MSQVNRPTFEKRLFLAPQKGFAFSQTEWERAWPFLNKDESSANLFSVFWKNNSLYFQVRPEQAEQVKEFIKDKDSSFGEVFKLLELSTVRAPKVEVTAP